MALPDMSAHRQALLSSSTSLGQACTCISLCFLPPPRRSPGTSLSPSFHPLTHQIPLLSLTSTLSHFSRLTLLSLGLFSKYFFITRETERDTYGCVHLLPLLQVSFLIQGHSHLPHLGRYHGSWPHHTGRDTSQLRPAQSHPLPLLTAPAGSRLAWQSPLPRGKRDVASNPSHIGFAY